MSDLVMIVVITVATLGVAALTVVLALSGQRKRRDELKAQAEAMGVRFDPKPDHEFVFALRDAFWIFRNARGKSVTNLVQTTSGGDTYRLFEYAYWRFASRTPH